MASVARPAICDLLSAEFPHDGLFVDFNRLTGSALIVRSTPDGAVHHYRMSENTYDDLCVDGLFGMQRLRDFVAGALMGDVWPL